jgi:hypothetical protein
MSKEKFTPEQLEVEINHIIDSGANKIRYFELFERYYTSRMAEAGKELPDAVILEQEEEYYGGSKQDGYLAGANRMRSEASKVIAAKDAEIAELKKQTFLEAEKKAENFIGFVEPFEKVTGRFLKKRI